MSNNFGFLQELLNTVADTSRNLLPRGLFSEDDGRGLQALVEALMSVRGEASGVVIANQLLRHYRELDDELRRVYFRYVAEALRPDPDVIDAAVTAYQANPDDEGLQALQDAVESPRQEFFRRLNMAPGATGEIVAMRRDLLGMVQDDPALRAIDRDLFHLLQSWFNRGFLVLRRIDWQTPASILEKIIAYEAVHEIDGWEDLRRRLEPADRRCFAFFHPSLVDEPLIFVEVALTQEVPDAIGGLLEPISSESDAPRSGPTTAVFYSISNCQEGLRGVSFGNFLIKQVVEELSKEFESLKTFVTLSPVPRFAQWLQGEREKLDESALLAPEERAALALLDDPDWWNDAERASGIRDLMMSLAARYFLEEKGRGNLPLDPVARFHLGNGARLERINWLGDTSDRGLRQAHGLMVNYLYEIKEIERNHEAFANDATIAASRNVRNLLRVTRRRKGASASSVTPATDPEPEVRQIEAPEPVEVDDVVAAPTSDRD